MYKINQEVKIKNNYFLNGYSNKTGKIIAIAKKYFRSRDSYIVKFSKPKEDWHDFLEEDFELI